MHHKAVLALNMRRYQIPHENFDLSLWLETSETFHLTEETDLEGPASVLY